LSELWTAEVPRLLRRRLITWGCVRVEGRAGAGERRKRGEVFEKSQRCDRGCVWWGAAWSGTMGREAASVQASCAAGHAAAQGGAASAAGGGSGGEVRGQLTSVMRALSSAIWPDSLLCSVGVTACTKPCGGRGWEEARMSQ
jgi:hypothetical protein